MPELPEVETVKRELQAFILDKPIAEVRLWRANLRYALAAEMPSSLKNLRFTAIERRGKYLIMLTDGDYALIAHLGMSGNFMVHANYRGLNEPLAHRHVDIAFTDGSALIYCDPRRFGFIELCRKDELAENRHVRAMGVEPLDETLTGDYLYERIRKTDRAIKNVLLDQRVIAGIGNIYACEALWLSGISPRRSGRRLSRASCARLVEAIRSVLAEAIHAGGSSLRDFRHASGDLGYFQHAWRCYGRAEEPCSRSGCSGVIRRIEQSGRSSYYCPRHQR